MRKLATTLCFTIVLLLGGAGAVHALPLCPLDQKPIYYDNCFANLKFSHGETYSGEVRDGKRNGQGTNTWPDGGIYVGEFKNDKSHGQGTYTYSNGDSYVGEFKYGERNGQGTYTWPNGNIYVGEYKDGKRNGQGNHSLSSGQRYVGEHKNDKPHGQGTYTYPNGGSYVGEFKDGVRNGQGTFRWPNGNIYVGEFKDDKINGQGTLTYADGRKEEGIWKDNNFQYAQSAEKTEKERLARQERQRAEEKRRAEALLAAQKKAEEADKLIAVGSGSSFAVNAEGTFISNQHVIDGCSKIELMKSGKPLEASVVASDERNDLALIQVSDPLDQEVFYRMSDEPIKVMDNVYVGGYPFGNLLGKNVKVTSGIISSMAGIKDDVSQLMIDAPIQPGNSGGPIFLTNGKLAAVTVASLDSLTILKSVDALPQNTNFGIKLSVLREFLSANNVTIPEQGFFTRDFERDELVNEAILQVICYARKGDVQKLKQRKVLFDALMRE